MTRDRKPTPSMVRRVSKVLLPTIALECLQQGALSQAAKIVDEQTTEQTFRTDGIFDYMFLFGFLHWDMCSVSICVYAGWYIVKLGLN